MTIGAIGDVTQLVQWLAALHRQGAIDAGPKSGV
jgi:hypothetical protein